jgi:FkbM family methyltransferase
MKVILRFCLIGLCISFISSQNLRQRRKQKRNLDKNAPEKALTVNYPLDFFTVQSSSDWRRSAIFDKNFVRENEKLKKWTEFSYAQDGEDIWLYENWFYGMKNGIIMESGALDGLLFSTSYMFEYFAGWTAIHVEADPENYKNLKLNREHAINAHCALCSEPQLLHYSSEGVVPVRGFVEFMSPSFIKKWHKNFYNNRTKLEDLPTVQCVTVKALLRELHVDHIDIWILDTEGAEESVLRGTDFSAVNINAVAMECDEHDFQKNARKTDILEANGFKCILIERNCMCKNNKHQASSAPEKSVLRKWDGVKWSSNYTASASI